MGKSCTVFWEHYLQYFREQEYSKFWSKINSPQGTLKEEDTIRYTNDSILSFA